MNRQIVNTDRAPKAIGPYSQGVKIVAKHLVFTAGQIPLDPENSLIVGDSIEKQTVQVLENLKSVLEAAGTSLQNVVKTTVFLKDMNDFSEMNEIYGKYFNNFPPARSAVEVSRLPKDVLIEIECVALIE